MLSGHDVPTTAAVAEARSPGPDPTPLYTAPAKGAVSTAEAVAGEPPAGASATVTVPVVARSEDAVPSASYDFAKLTRSEQRLDDIFRQERTDPVWASQTVDSLNLVLSQMPERSVIGDYGLTCKESLCKLEIRGDPKLLAGNDPKSNVQPALLKMMSEPPASELFDDDMMNVTVENDGLATITLFAHRRKPKR